MIKEVKIKHQLIIVGILIFLDFLTTYIAITYFGLVEGNILPKIVIQRHGFQGLFIFDLLFFSLYSWLLISIYNKDIPVKIKILKYIPFYAIAILYLIVVISNTYTIIYLS